MYESVALYCGEEIIFQPISVEAGVEARSEVAVIIISSH